MIDYLVKKEDIEMFEDELADFGYRKINNAHEHELYATSYCSDNEYELVEADYSTLSFPLYKGSFLEKIDKDKFYVDDKEKKIVGPSEIVSLLHSKLYEYGYLFTHDFINDIEKLFDKDDSELSEPISLSEAHEKIDLADDVIRKITKYKKLIEEKKDLEYNKKIKPISIEGFFEALEEKHSESDKYLLNSEGLLKENIYFIAESKDSLIETLEILSKLNYETQHQSAWEDIKPKMTSEGVLRAASLNSEPNMLKEWKVEQLQKDDIPIVINPILRLAHFTIPDKGIGLDYTLRLPDITKLYRIKDAPKQSEQERDGNTVRFELDSFKDSVEATFNDSNSISESIYEEFFNSNNECFEELANSITTEKLRKIDSLDASDMKVYIKYAKAQHETDERNPMLIKYIGLKAENELVLKQTLLELHSMNYTTGVNLNNGVVLDSLSLQSNGEFYTLNANELHDNNINIIIDITSDSLTAVKEDDLLTLFQNINPANYKNLKLH